MIDRRTLYSGKAHIPAHICLIISLIFIYIPVIGQVINDNIESRLELTLNTPRSSNTSNCTLQWACINKKLTGKCIQYHNDQWFFFRTFDHNKLYLNISSQECRDLRGVQIIVIDGTACKPQSYEIVKCISLGNHNDIFVELINLKINHEYMVQIDGYLHDFCAFEIEVSDIPKGLPLLDRGIVRAKAEIKKQQRVTLQWSIADSTANSVRKYEIWRRHETDFKSIMVHEIKQGFNAYGSPRLEYTIEDKVSNYGRYHYEVVGVGDQDRILISKTSILNRKPEFLREAEKHWLSVDLDFAEKCRLKISVFDARNHELLNYFIFNFTPENKTFETYIKDYMDEGITNYRVQVEHLGNGTRQNFMIKK